MGSKTGEAIGYGQLQLVSPFEVQTLDKIRFKKTVNEHGQLYVTGIFPEDKQDHYIETATSNDNIALHEIDQDGNVVRILFQGVIDEFAVRVVRNIYYFELTALSYTHLMDLEQKTRSFQNKDITYRELIQSIIKPEYPKSDFIIDVPSGKKAIEEIAVQFKETDWQFLKRLASRLGYVLIPEPAAASPKFWVGLPERYPDDGDLPDFYYTVKKPLHDYQETAALGFGDGLHHNDFLCYEIEAYKALNIGGEGRRPLHQRK